MNKKFIIMHEKDNCATTLEDFEEGTEVKRDNQIFTINQKIPLGHKFAIKNIKKGELVYKYGQIIGIATEDISLGDWIHTHNITSHYLEEVAG